MTNYNTTISSSELNSYLNSFFSSYDSSGLMVFFISIFLIIMVIALTAAVLQSIGLWKIFNKAGKKGWQSIVPIYNQYILCQITGISPWWILIACGAGIISAFLGPLSFIVSIATLYFAVLLSVSLARAFGKEDVFAVGLILFAPIFYLILGCDKSEYLGKKPMNDFIFKNDNQNNTEQKETVNQTTTQDEKHCVSCGKQIPKTSQYCPICGTKQGE